MAKRSNGQKFISPTAEKWFKKSDINGKVIQQIYNLPFSVTKDIKLSMFQFKIKHNFLPTNAILFQDGFKDNDLCHLCNDRQTLYSLPALMFRSFGPTLSTGGIIRTAT